jgi:integrin alpha FG-GAP repeat containing protein 1
MLLAILLGTLTSAYEILDFRPSPFVLAHEPGIYEVNSGLESPNTVLAAFAFINTGTDCDVLVLNEDHCSVSVYIWSRKEGRFLHMVIFNLQIAGYIKSVIPYDFNNDGATDLLITKTWEGVQTVEIYYQTRNSFQPTATFTFNRTISHPAILDINGDISPDIILNTINDTGQSAAYVLEVSIDNTYHSRSLMKYKFQSAVHCLNSTNEALSDPHSVAFVDLNRDCLADIFLTTVNSSGEVYFEVWLNMKNGEYCVVQSTKAPKGAGQVSFADVDQNGAEDLIFPVCIGDSCQEASSIQVIFNYNKAPSSCQFENSDISIRAFVPFQFNSTALLIQLPPNHTFTTSSPDMPFRVQTGDLDLDGYPELMFLLDDGLGPYCSLFRNVPGEEAGNRSFVLWPESDLRKLRAKRGAYLCSFFDLDENGILDILLTLFQSNHSYTYSFYNVPEESNMHLKALMLTNTEQQEYSSALTGAVFVFTQRKLDFSRKVTHGSQLTQTSYFALQPPYCVFGLGKDTIAIESFIAARPTIAHSARVWTPMVPRISVIIEPYETDVSLWQLRLYDCPQERLARVMLGAFTMCVIIGLWVLVRLRAERARDKRQAEADFQAPTPNRCI